MHLPPPEPRADPPRHPRRDPLPGAGDEDRDPRRGLHAGGLGRVPAGDGHVALHARDGEAPREFVDGCIANQGCPARRRGGAVPPVRRVRQLRLRQEPRRRLRADGLRVELPQAVLPGAVHGRAHQRPADGLLPGGGARQRREAPRRRDPPGGRQPVGVPDHDRVGGAAGLGAGRPGRGRRLPRRRPGRGAARRDRHRRPPAARALVRVRDPAGRLTRPLGRGVRQRLGRPAGAAPREGDRRGDDGPAGRGARPGAVHEPRGRRGADGALGGGRGAADPGRGARLAGPAAAGAAVAAARGGGRHEGARRRADGARARTAEGGRAGRWTCGCPRPRRRRSPR